MLDEYQEKYGDTTKVSDINMADYGIMNGEKVFASAMQLLEG